MKNNNKVAHIDEWIARPDQTYVKLDGKIFDVRFDKFFKKAGDYKLVNSFLYDRNDKKIGIVPHYINYYLNYYDEDKELLNGYLVMKYMIDIKRSIKTEKEFINRIYDTIITETAIERIKELVEDNYILDIDSDTDNGHSLVLKFTNEHIKHLCMISTAMKMMLPLTFHFINTVKKKTISDSFLYDLYEPLFDIFNITIDGMDLYEKLYTFISAKSVSSTSRDNKMWNKLEILGHDATSHDDATFKDIIISSSIVKYNFSESILGFNKVILERQIIYKLRMTFKEELIELQPGPKMSGGERAISAIDAIEMRNSKIDESISILAEVNTLKNLDMMEKKFKIDISDEEIDFYMKHYKMSPFQDMLISYHYAKYFGGFRNLECTTKRETIRLLILLKKKLELYGNIFLPQLLSGNILNRLNSRTIQNSKFLSKMDCPLYHNLINNKFKSLKILNKEDEIIKMTSTLINTQFTYVDFDHPEKLGEVIEIHSDILCDEFLNFLNQI